MNQTLQPVYAGRTGSADLVAQRNRVLSADFQLLRQLEAPTGASVSLQEENPFEKILT